MIILGDWAATRTLQLNSLEHSEREGLDSRLWRPRPSRGYKGRVALLVGVYMDYLGNLNLGPTLGSNFGNPLTLSHDVCCYLGPLISRKPFELLNQRGRHPKIKGASRSRTQLVVVAGVLPSFSKGQAPKQSRICQTPRVHILPARPQVRINLPFGSRKSMCCRFHKTHDTRR